MAGAPQRTVYSFETIHRKNPKIYGTRFNSNVKFFDLTFDKEITYERFIVPNEPLNTKTPLVTNEEVAKLSQNDLEELLKSKDSITDISLEDKSKYRDDTERSRKKLYSSLESNISNASDRSILYDDAKVLEFYRKHNIYINIADSNIPLCIGHFIYSVKGPDTPTKNIMSQNVRLYDLYFYNYYTHLLYRVLICKKIKSKITQSFTRPLDKPYWCVVFQYDNKVPRNTFALSRGTGTMASSAHTSPEYPAYNIMCTEMGDYITTGKDIHSFFSKLTSASPVAALSSPAVPSSGGRKRRSSRRRKSSRKSRKSRRR